DILKLKSGGGDWQAFWSRYTPMIQRWMRARGLSEQDVQEVTAEVRLKLVKGMPEFECTPGHRFRGWLKTVVRNAVNDLLREWKCRPDTRGAGGSDALASLQGLADPDSTESLIEELNSEVERERRLLWEAFERAQKRVEEHTWRA